MQVDYSLAGGGTSLRNLGRAFEFAFGFLPGVPESLRLFLANYPPIARENFSATHKSTSRGCPGFRFLVPGRVGQAFEFDSPGGLPFRIWFMKRWVRSSPLLDFSATLFLDIHSDL